MIAGASDIPLPVARERCMFTQLHHGSAEEAVDSPWIVWLGQPECHRRMLSGGKAAYLSILATDFRVPEGFCLTTAAFEHERVAGFAAKEPTTEDYALSDAL